MNWTDATTVTQLGEHRFRAHVDEQWTSLQGVHGGVVAAIAVNASSTVLRDEGADPAAQLRAGDVRLRRAATPSATSPSTSRSFDGAAP